MTGISPAATSIWIPQFSCGGWFILRFGSLPISKEVNRKKKSEAEGACLVPVNGDGLHFTKIDYLYSF
uniref:Neuronal regeneration-related protein n=1 Tax=Falco tinnunculus TaxID=100819 RepID=A0A8C4UIM7_FALTI